MPRKSVHQMTESELLRTRAALVQDATRLGVGHLSEDLASDVLLSWLESDQGGEGVNHRYELVSAIRRAREREQSLDALSTDDAVYDPPGALGHGLVLWEIASQLDRLSETQRLAFIGREIGGLSHEDLAVRLGVSAETVRKRAEQAKAALKAYFQAQYGLEFPDGREGAKKPGLADEMRGGRAKRMRG